MSNSGGIIKINERGTIKRRYWVRGIYLRATDEPNELKIDVTIVTCDPKENVTEMQIHLDLPEGVSIIDENEVE